MRKQIGVRLKLFIVNQPGNTGVIKASIKASGIRRAMASQEMPENVLEVSLAETVTSARSITMETTGEMRKPG